MLGGKVMIAKLVYDTVLDQTVIKWVEEEGPILGYTDYLNFACINPEWAQGLYRYYESTFLEISRLWEEKKNKQIAWETIFGITTKEFLNMVENIEYKSYELFIYDYEVYYEPEQYCKFDYYKFVDFVKELSKILQ
jgi:hypothetical protein